MDIQDSSIPKTSPEINVDGSSEDTAIDKASQDGCRPTEDMSSYDMATDQASQDGRKTIEGNKEVCINVSSKDATHTEVSQDGCKTMGDVSSKDMTTDNASHDGHKTTREVNENGSSEGTATNEVSQDGRKPTEGSLDFTQKKKKRKRKRKRKRKPTEEVHEERSSERMATLREDALRWIGQTSTVESKVLPRAVVHEDYRRLFEDVVNGDWKKIKMILNVDTAMTAKVMTIESDQFTMLDVAVMAAQDQLVEKLVKHFLPKCEDLRPDRALCLAAGGGRIRMVKALLNKVDAESAIIEPALEFATKAEPIQEEVIWFLARRLKYTPKTQTIINLISVGHMDTCLYIAHKFPDSLTFEVSKDVEFFKILALMACYFRSGAELNFWEKSIYKFIPLCLIDTSFDDFKNTKMAQALAALNRIKVSLWNLATIPAPFIKRTGELKFRHSCSLGFTKLALTRMKENIDTIEILESILTSRAVLDAASRGVFEIVDLCLKYFPELMWDKNFEKELKIEIVKGRHVELFRLVNAHDPIRCLRGGKLMRIDLMEAVTKWSPRCVSSDVSGAAFLLQRELQWFQVVEGSSGTRFKWLKFQVNSKTYWEVFVEHRKELLKEARQWTKDTSSSCSLVATLIITVAFAAAFTLPGGNDSNTGIPKFLKNGSFMVFVVADALALFCSVTATLMFLAILTSRYAIEDFLYSVPRNMILGLTFLFLSLAFMLVAFGSTLTIVLSEQLEWIDIPITLIAAFTVVVFAVLQLPLYIEMVESTFWPRLYRPLKLWK